MKWYYSNAKKEVIGPLSETELGELLSNGSIFPKTWVCAQDTEQWVSYDQAFPDSPDGALAPPPIPGTSTTSANSFFQKHRKLILIGGGVAACLFLFMMILVFAIAASSSGNKSSENHNYMPGYAPDDQGYGNNSAPTCSTCRGSGQGAGQCNQCFGAGTIMTSGNMSPGGDANFQTPRMQVPCPRCRGGGQMAVPCHRCKGSGRGY